jgi:hypothetical protein
MRRFTVIPLLALAAACSEVSPTGTSLQRAEGSLASQVESNTKDAVDFYPLTACNGETVIMTGELHQVFKFTTTKSGNVSAFLSADYSLSGVGSTTGAKYNATTHIRDQEMASDNVSNFSYRTSTKLVGAGKVPNSTIDFTVRVLVANGETRVENIDISTHCSP